MNRYAIGVDIGGSHLLCVAVDLKERALEEKTRIYQKMDSQGTAEQIFSAWSGVINRVIDRLGEEKVSGIGLAMPGPFDYSAGIAWFKDNEKYESIYGLKIEEHLRPLLTLPKARIRYHNDASCFGIGEDEYGVAQGKNRSLHLTLGTGFGSAFIDDGIPIVEREDVPEDGCLWHVAFEDGIADQYFSTRWFVNKYLENSGKRIAGVKELAELAEAGNAVKQLFDLFGRNMGKFLTPWIQRFGPDLIVFGGNISKAHALFFPALSDALEARGVQVPLRLSELGEDAAVLGAARLLDDDYFDKLRNFLPKR